MALLQSDSLMLKRGAKISDEEFRDLAKYIYELLGIEIPEKRRYLLENRLGTRLDALSLKSFSEYLAYLHHDPGNVAEMDQLINQITTNETSFYRDMVQLENFRDKVLKPLLAKRMASGTKTLRIWSAGCS
ncbi:MAG: protein-glutamate O-methyltransferase CheR, partial [Proteobacteria bacterium]|nr:protein-glutamate O-methyltransferase CheR [Pseudomonadota bacterium]